MKHINRLFIANRGEIAVRIIRTCRRLGIETILGASEADMQSQAAMLADITVSIGKPRASESYLNIKNIIAAAVQAGADGLHPGYGFLSENRQLAEACAEAEITFVGPTVQQLDAVGDKLKARSNALVAGLPLVPGGEVKNLDDAMALIELTGYPILIKAVGGGGGRGMKRVYSETELAAAMDMAIAEASAAFGDPRIYLERFVVSGRHVEVQVLGDGQRVIHLGTRDCSIQRRYQKLVEEAPAPLLSDNLEDAMQDAAVAFAEHLLYRGLGTVELLVDVERETFYFLEMNARIQVEHPVTEMISGLDLVEEQIAIAEGHALRLWQTDVNLTGHAIECRINAENWLRDFQPSPGRVRGARFPVGEGIRTDTCLQAGEVVQPYYDSLVAKLIVHGESREAALQKMQLALRNCRIDGITTNLPMHQALMDDGSFVRGGVDTGYFTEFLQGVAKASDTEVLN